MDERLKARLDRAIGRVFEAAEAALRTDGAAPHLLRLEGRGGEATVGLPARPTDGERQCEKAHLLRAALEADLEASAFEARLVIRGGAAARVVVAVAGSDGSWTMAMAGVYRTPAGHLALRRMAAPIAGPGGSDTLMLPFGATRDIVRPVTPEDAWQRLAQLGVNIFDAGAAVH